MSETHPTWLTGEQVEALWLEYDLLRAQETRIAARTKEILDTLRQSGESKVKAMRDAEARAGQ